jgi:hypothetical protein
MSTLSSTDICNRALDKLGAAPINTIAAPVLLNEQRFARIYPQTKARELKRHRWVFAFEEVELSPLVARSLEGRYRFPLPVDCLRPLRDDNTTWLARGRELWDIGTGPLRLTYIKDVTETEFDAAFVEVLACRLAYEMAEIVTQNANKKEAAFAEWKEALADARRDNAFIVGEEVLNDSDNGFDWVTGRF